MLHPSYLELMNKTNRDVQEGETPIVQSRYSIVIATAKRARQLIDGADALVESKSKKPLSVAVEELQDNKVNILSEGDSDSITTEDE